MATPFRFGSAHLTLIFLLATLAAPSTLAQPPTPGVSEAQIESGGEAREYRLYIPASYDPDGAPVPLVVSMHGLTSNAKDQEWLSGLSDKADEAGFIVVYPQGLGAPTRWNTAPDDRRRAQDANADVGFIHDLVAYLQGELNLDPARIYATGMSNGGGMTNRLACDMADVFAAVAPVAGAYNFADACDPARPVPVMAFHGLDDPIVPYEGAETDFLPGKVLPPIHKWAADWADRDGCDPDPAVAVETYDAYDVTVERWGECDAGAEVVLYSIDGIGHVWPGGPNIPILGSNGPVSATDLMWDFFAAHPMPEAE